ncbi:glutamine synthetase [Limibacter armeniacum]|uniref:glutamine synthetase family protein n=1 Tax=Limibacter armeniacum TaxID=466084 RepID=UPI002FE503E6
MIQPVKYTTQEIRELMIRHTSPKVKIAVADMDGILRGKVVSKEKFLSILEKGFGFCDVIFGWDASDELYEKTKVTGWHTGFPDAPANVDVNTFREIPWDSHTPFFLADFSKSDTFSEVCPRTLLKKLREETLSDGFQPIFSQEFEWFNFSETPSSLIEKDFQDLIPITPGMFGYSILRSSYKSAYFNQLFEDLSNIRVPLEGLHTETGPGVYEAAIQATDILEAADRAVLFKTSVKEIAFQHEIIASFMARWNKNLPGCSGHVHQSLWDTECKRNLFYDPNGRHKMSKLMNSYLAGQMRYLPELLPLCAPTTNSYKRLVEGYWAPTTINWGIDNRTTSFRVLPQGESASRIETRIVGSDTNPYLAMSACLAAGLYGIRNDLSLEQELIKGNGYEDKEGRKLASSLEEATTIFRNSEVAHELLGETFVHHFAMSREWEAQQYNADDPRWELRRYFEII